MHWIKKAAAEAALLEQNKQDPQLNSAMAQIDRWSCKQLPSNPDDDVQQQALLMLERASLPQATFTSSSAHAYINGEKTLRVKNITGFISKLRRSISDRVSAISQAMATESPSQRSFKDECRILAWSLVINALMQQHPGSQLPERLISSIRKHFHSLSVNYARAGFTTETVFLHIRLLEQALLERSSLLVCVQEQQCGPANFCNFSQSSSSLTSPSNSDSWDDDDQAMAELVLTFAFSASV